MGQHDVTALAKGQQLTEAKAYPVWSQEGRVPEFGDFTAISHDQHRYAVAC